MTNTAHDVTVDGYLFRYVFGESEALRIAAWLAGTEKRSIVEVTGPTGAVIWTSTDREE